MSIESEFFKRSRPDFRKLERSGFLKEKGNYFYSAAFFDRQFRAELTISETGIVTGRVIDVETEEEYLPIRLQHQVGGFIGSVREAYLGVLQEILDACFVPVHFVYDQSNRIESWIRSEYGVAAEFPWERYPGCGTFKCANNEKWFAALLDVEYGKLTGDEDADQIVEVINLKADPDEIPTIVQTPGIFPAWHMNKKHWISVVMDDTVSDADVKALIRKSYRLASGKPAGKVSASGAWMIPSNPKVYDVDRGFRAGGGVISWHQHNNIKAGDEVYIYCSAPFSAIIYRCEVVEADLGYNGLFKGRKGYDRSMRIRLIEKYPPDRYPLAFIKAHGGSVVRSARSMPEELHRAIKEK
ncbi:MAG: MmcQ/YjbR family DNA-binding protein [Firmicutes bacterium]|nr:MmcQ/YjbR family DNA-binding protein [Bacillota bacterium]